MYAIYPPIDDNYNDDDDDVAAVESKERGDTIVACLVLYLSATSSSPHSSTYSSTGSLLREGTSKAGQLLTSLFSQVSTVCSSHFYLFLPLSLSGWSVLLRVRRTARCGDRDGSLSCCPSCSLRDNSYTR